MPSSLLRGTAAGKRTKLDCSGLQCHALPMDHVLSARYATTGKPSEVVLCDRISLPPPGRGEAQVRMIHAPINPADLNMLEGKYGEARPLPDTPGNEGLGEILAIGKGGPPSLVGQRVLVGSEAWRTHGNWRIEDLLVVPPGIDDRHACMLRVNPPTAWLLLHHFTALQPGDWIVQNAATSGVGRAVMEIAGSAGWKTLNIVRNPQAADTLRSLGANAVLADTSDLAAQAAEILGSARPRLGLNAVGGSSATRVAGLLANGATLATYGAMSREALKIPNGFLIFRDIAFRGFWLTQWLRRASAAERDRVSSEVFRLAAKGLFAPRVAAEFPLEKVREAVALAASGTAGGKVLLRLRD